MAVLLYEQILIKKGRKRGKTGGKPSVFFKIVFDGKPFAFGLLRSLPFHRPFGQPGFCLPLISKNREAFPEIEPDGADILLIDMER